MSYHTAGCILEPKVSRPPLQTAGCSFVLYLELNPWLALRFTTRSKRHEAPPPKKTAWRSCSQGSPRAPSSTTRLPCGTTLHHHDCDKRHNISNGPHLTFQLPTYSPSSPHPASAQILLDQQATERTRRTLATLVDSDTGASAAALLLCGCGCGCAAAAAARAPRAAPALVCGCGCGSLLRPRQRRRGGCGCGRGAACCCCGCCWLTAPPG